jgi:hypothetical protein
MPEEIEGKLSYDEVMNRARIIATSFWGGRVQSSIEFDAIEHAAKAIADLHFDLTARIAEGARHGRS